MLMEITQIIFVANFLLYSIIIVMYVLNWYFITVAVTVDDDDKVKEEVTAMLEDRVKC